MGRSGFDPSWGAACGPGRGENERRAPGSRLGRREKEEENAPMLLLPTGNRRSSEPTHSPCVLFALSPANLLVSC